jgi:hypothetical protein
MRSVYRFTPVKLLLTRSQIIENTHGTPQCLTCRVGIRLWSPQHPECILLQWCREAPTAIARQLAEFGAGDINAFPVARSGFPGIQHRREGTHR